MQEEVVSFCDEPLILVDSEDQVLGYLDKISCHEGEGKLHRAFSAFVFNSKGELLIQQRHLSKMLSGGFWANSCCSHPRKGESMDVAVERRLQEELGLELALKYFYRFEYHAYYNNKGSEHELCSVYVGVTDAEPKVNTTELAAWKMIAPEQLDQELENNSSQYTPWFKMEWKALRENYWSEIQAMFCA